jgi:hypothetical protein
VSDFFREAAAYGLFYGFPLLLIVLAWRGWMPRRSALSKLRSRVFAGALALSFFALACMLAVHVYLRQAHLDYWQEFMFSLPWARVNLPVSLLAFVGALFGAGYPRVLLSMVGLFLSVAWLTAFIH